MKYKSQNNETEVVLKYFNGFVGNLLDIGANNGFDLSNSYDLLNSGWHGTLVEPVKAAFNAIQERPNVEKFNFGIGEKTGIFDFCNASDSLLATTKPNMLVKWTTVTHEVVPVQFYTFADALLQFMVKRFDFITIDAEGMDFEILHQMNLTDLGCKCICIEHNSTPQIAEKMKFYCASFGLSKELLRNGENIIMAL
jgi:FkbM family methyltransferase